MSDKLQGIHPRLVIIVQTISEAMRILGFPMMVTDGMRTALDQEALYAKGRTAPGVIVTNADGIVHKSNHQVHADGYGHAVDMAFVDKDGHPSWAEHWPWKLYGEAAKALGCEWGGSWQTLIDRPHIELPDGIPTVSATKHA